MSDSEDSKSIGHTVLGYIDKGVEASKKGIHSVGNAITEFGDRSVLRIELENLKSKKKKTFTNLGEYLYNKIKACDSEISISSEEEKIRSAIKYIDKINKKIQEHEDILNQNKKHGSDDQ